MDINKILKGKEIPSNATALSFYVKNSSEIIIAIDNNLKICFVNEAFCVLLGRDQSSVLGKKITEYLDDQNAEKFAVIKETGSQESFKVELSLRVSEKLIKWLDANILHYKNFIVLIARDVTDEKNKRDKESEEIRNVEAEKIRSQEILNSIGDGVISVNDKGEMIYVNRQAVELLGFQEEELIGELIWRKVIMFGQNNAEVDVESSPIRLALFTRKRIYENSNFYKSKDGRLIPVSITATPLIIHGLVVGGVNIFRDITREREIDRMKTEFISLASHQLRTPLSATKWFAELILDDSKNLNSEQTELINNIYKSNQRMIDLVNALLNISRIESGRIIIEPKMTDLRKLVEDVIMELTPKIKEKRHNVILSIHEDLPMISIDPKLVRNVYMNLLTNSIKYTREGGEIMVLISKRENEVVSQVSDNGLGIPDNQKQRMFEKFFRSSNIIKVETDGTGLGLYLAKAIVESSGGKIWFESEVNKGTTFWFTLPLSGSPAKTGEVSINS